MADFSISQRQAQETDIPKIVSLVLTSFRQSPLFDFLYSALRDNIDYAHDTVCFWSRRVQGAICDPSASVMVAECESSFLPHDSGQSGDEPWRMLRWITNRAKLLQLSLSADTVSVAFTTWRWNAIQLPVTANEAAILSRYSNHVKSKVSILTPQRLIMVVSNFRSLPGERELSLQRLLQ